MAETITLKKLSSMTSGYGERLRQLWKPLQNILTFSLADPFFLQKRVLFVSVERKKVSVACGASFLSKIHIKGVAVYPFEDRYPSPESLASIITLAKNKLRAVNADIVIGVPKAWALTKIAEFPLTVKEQLPEVISYEMDRLTPFSAEEALYDFRILREEPAKIAVLVAAMKEEVMRPYMNALREHGHAIKGISLGLAGMGALCRIAGKCPDVLIVRVDLDEYEAATFSGELLTGTYAGRLMPKEGTTRTDALLSEMAPLISMMKEQGKSPELYIHDTGQTISLDHIIRALPVPVRSFSQIALPAGIPSSGIDFPYEAAGGAFECLWPKASSLNLMSKGRKVATKTPFVFTLFLCLLLGISWLAYSIAPLRFENNRLNEINRQIASRKDTVKKVEEHKKEIDGLEKEINLVTQFKGSHALLLNVARDITKILPKNAWLTRMRIGEKGVDLEGYANAATELLPKLEASPYLRKAEFSSPTFRDARMNSDRFNIRMEIEPAQAGEELRGKNEKK